MRPIKAVKYTALFFLFFTFSCGKNLKQPQAQSSLPLVTLPEGELPTIETDFYSEFYIEEETESPFPSDFDEHLAECGVSSRPIYDFNSLLGAKELDFVDVSINQITARITHYDALESSSVGGLLLGKQRKIKIEDPVVQEETTTGSQGIDMTSGVPQTRNSFLYSFEKPVNFFGADFIDLESLSPDQGGEYALFRFYDESENIIKEVPVIYPDQRTGNKEIHFIGHISEKANISHVQVVVGDLGTTSGFHMLIAFDNLSFGRCFQ